MSSGDMALFTYKVNNDTHTVSPMKDSIRQWYRQTYMYVIDAITHDVCVLTTYS